MGYSIDCQPHFGRQIEEKTAVCFLPDRLPGGGSLPTSLQFT